MTYNTMCLCFDTGSFKFLDTDMQNEEVVNILKYKFSLYVSESNTRYVIHAQPL